MKLSQLKYFQTTCQYNSMTLAARELNISQSSLSVAIRELETEFGVVLFHRSNNRLKLTEEGEILYELSSGLLKQADDLVEEMQALGSNHQEILIGVPPAISLIIFPKLFSRFHSVYPNSHITLKEMGTHDCIDRMKSGDLDVALISGEVPSSSILGSVKICTLKVQFYTAAKNALAELPVLTAADFTAFLEEPLVLLNSGTFINSFVSNLFHEKDIKPNVILYTNQLSTIQQLVSDGVASTFLYEETFLRDETITSVPLEGDSDARISLIWNKKNQQSKDVKNLIQLLLRERKNSEG